MLNFITSHTLGYDLIWNSKKKNLEKGLLRRDARINRARTERARDRVIRKKALGVHVEETNVFHPWDMNARGIGRSGHECDTGARVTLHCLPELGRLPGAGER